MLSIRRHFPNSASEKKEEKQKGGLNDNN